MSSTAHVATSRGYRSVLRTRALRAVFIAHAVSMTGSIAAEVALSILVYQRTGSALLSALVLVCSFLPYAVGGTVLSAVADRYPARRVLVACDMASAVSIAAMLTPGIPVLGLLGLLLLTGTIAPIFQGARAGGLAQLLDADTFPIGRSLLRAISQSAVLAGFAAGSLVVAAIGPSWLLAADAASFVASAALIGLGTPFTAANTTSERGGARVLLGASVSGLRYVVGNPTLRRLIGLSWAAPAFGSVADGLAVAYTAQTGRAASAAGALFTGYAAGTVLGEVVVARLRPDTRRRLVLPLILASQLPLVAFLARPNLPIAAALLTIAGSGFAFNQGLDPLILTATADTYRGRVFTVQGSGLMTVQGLGIALAGLAGSMLAPNLVIGAAGALGTLITQGLAHRALANRRSGGSEAVAEPSCGERS